MTVGDGLMYKLFSDLGVNGKLLLTIKDFYTDVEAWVLYSGASDLENLKLHRVQGKG